MTYEQELLAALARGAELEIVLATARSFVVSARDLTKTGPVHEWAVETIRRIDRALDGTIHSFTPNGANR